MSVTTSLPEWFTDRDKQRARYTAGFEMITALSHRDYAGYCLALHIFRSNTLPANVAPAWTLGINRQAVEGCTVTRFVTRGAPKIRLQIRIPGIMSDTQRTIEFNSLEEVSFIDPPASIDRFTAAEMEQARRDEAEWRRRQVEAFEIARPASNPELERIQADNDERIRNMSLALRREELRREAEIRQAIDAATRQFAARADDLGTAVVANTTMNLSSLQEVAQGVSSFGEALDRASMAIGQALAANDAEDERRMATFQRKIPSLLEEKEEPEPEPPAPIRSKRLYKL